MVTVRDVAERAQVSIGTVSRVVNGNPAVRAPIRDAVLAAIRELGYQPNALARSLRSSRTKTLGLIVNDLNNPPSVTLLRGAEDAAREAGYTVLVVESRNDVEVESQHLQALLDRRIDGLMCVPVRSINLVARATAAAGVPIVMLSQRVPHAHLATAYVEETAGIEHAMEHLTGLGHRRFAVVHGTGNAIARARTGHVESFLERRGFLGERTQQLLWTFPQAGEGEATVARLLLAEQAPTALIVGGHQYLPTVLLGIRQAGKIVPRDLSLVAFGDSRWAEAMSPAVTVITSDQKQHAIDAVEMLLRMINGDEAAPRSVSTESTFIARASCGPAPDAVAV